MSKAEFMLIYDQIHHMDATFIQALSHTYVQRRDLFFFKKTYLLYFFKFNFQKRVRYFTQSLFQYNDKDLIFICRFQAFSVPVYE